MSKLRHIKIEGTADTIPYIVKPTPQKEFNNPPRDREVHAKGLISNLNQVRDDAAVLHADIDEDSYTIPIEFRSDSGYQLLLDSLGNRQYGIEVVSVHDEDGVMVAVVRVPPGKMSFFFKLIDQYENKESKGGKFRNAKLVESIASARLAGVRSYWTDEKTLFPDSGQSIWWEVWLRCPRGAEGDHILHEFRLKMCDGITLDERVVRFNERAVLLAWCTPQDWSRIPDLMDDLAEMRKAKEPVGPYLELSPKDQASFIKELLSRVTPPVAQSPAVCVLDTGVAWAHPLLAAGIAQASALTVNPSWGPSDHEGHGTEVAGLALYGCLATLFKTQDAISLTHFLESVKILPPTGRNDPINYGAITQEAIARIEKAFPNRNRSVCLAVTSDDRDQGFPTLWSAAIDQYSAGELDDKKRLIFICTGNIRDLRDPQSGYQYPQSNRKHGIEDPAQSWNAITVGAYTEKGYFWAGGRDGLTPISPCGLLGPTSRTSMLLSHDWPIKPDVVMEGGNWVSDSSGRLDTVDDYSLLTTSRPIEGRLLTTFGDTSAAVALASRFGAILQSRYPSYWPETIRGIIIHSAKWTDEMLKEFPRPKRKERLRCYGWGVPQIEKAIWSTENAVTLVYEGQMQPYDKITNKKVIDGKVSSNTSVKHKDMHFHKLPWPVDVLRQIASETVRMRITLSYFIEPSPGRRGWTRKHRYASHGLRFDVKRPTESLDDFRVRLTQSVQEDELNVEGDGEGVTTQSAAAIQPWALGPKLRARGSVHSDWWEGSAAELADSGYIGIHPVTGWWRERGHLNRWDSIARYSLIVSLETPRTNIDLYTPIATQIGIDSSIQV